MPIPTVFSASFPPASHADWLAQVQKDLKDSNVYETLRWSSSEGFTVEPYYSAVDIEPDKLQALQRAQKLIPGWLNTPAYTVSAGQEKAVNTALRDAIVNGADALILNLSPDSSTSNEISLPRLLDGIKLSETPVFFQLSANSDVSLFLKDLRQVAPYQLRGSLFASAGTFPVNTLAEAIEQSSDSPNFRPISISSHDFHSAGATATQELAFTIARLSDTFNQLGTAGMPPEQLLPKTVLSVSVGTSYFIEMAKLRALRALVARLFPAATEPPVQLHCQTSTFYEAAATPYTNLLRATTEAMAAVIGGADVLTIRPYDAVLETSTTGPGEFSQRIARNVSTMLKAESYLDKVADPAAGSYYIETLTSMLIEAAWVLFQQVQEMGGLTKAMASGYVQEVIEKSFQEKVIAVENGRVLVGVTKFRHDEEGASAKPTRQDADQSTDLMGLESRRLPENFE